MSKSKTLLCLRTTVRWSQKDISCCGSQDGFRRVLVSHTYIIHTKYFIKRDFRGRDGTYNKRVKYNGRRIKVWGVAQGRSTRGLFMSSLVVLSCKELMLFFSDEVKKRISSRERTIHKGITCLCSIHIYFIRILLNYPNYMYNKEREKS